MELWAGPIPVCFRLATPWALKQEIRSAVERSWEHVANVDFVGWGDCLAAEQTAKVTVCALAGAGGAQAASDGRATERVPDGTTFDPMAWVGSPSDVAFAASQCSVRLWVRGQSSWVTGKRLDYFVVHEFGHVLGFDHEQNRDDNPLATGDCGHGTMYWPNKWTVYDPNSVMHYCNDEDNGSGRLTDIDVEGAQAAYGVNPSGDDDGDGVPDYRDNCPYASNVDQADANFDAELAVERRTNPTSDGHRPTPSEAQSNPGYVAAWQATFRGDACDGNAASAVEPFVGATTKSGVQHVLTVSVASTITSGGAAPKYTTGGIRFQSYLSDPTAMRRSRSGQTTPSFCLCDRVGQGAVEQAKCSRVDLDYKCLPGRDNLFATNPSNPPGQWHRITKDGAGVWGADQSWFKAKNGKLPFAPQPAEGTWDFEADLPGLALPSSTSEVPGILWGHVVWNERPPAIDLGNGYAPTIAMLADSIVVRYEWPIYTPILWWPDPVLVASTTSPARFLSVWPGEGAETWAIAETTGGGREVSAHFTKDALDALRPVWGAGGPPVPEVLPATSNLLGIAFHDTMPVAIVVDAGTTRIRGALRADALGRIDYEPTQSPLPSQSASTQRLYVAQLEALLSLEGSGVDARLYQRPVAAAMAGDPQSTWAAISGVTLAERRSMAWDQGSHALYVLDTPADGDGPYARLVAIDLAGHAAVVWRTKSDPEVLTDKWGLSTSSMGEIVVTLSHQSTTEVVLFDAAGHAVASTSTSGEHAFGALANLAGVTLPQARAPSVDQSNVEVRWVPRADLGAGACAATWLRDNGLFPAAVPAVECP